mgnify:CR=1 FL=1
MYTMYNARILALLISSTFIVQGCSPQKVAMDSETKVEQIVKEKQLSDLDSVKAGQHEHLPHTQNNLAQTFEIAAPTKAVNRLSKRSQQSQNSMVAAQAPSLYYPPQQYYSQESYNPAAEQSFISTENDSLSTFSIDVDTASYANIRRFLQSGQKVPVGAVRIEEMLNYFQYDYPVPENAPVAISAELGPCLWNPGHKIAMIGLKAKEIPAQDLPPSNLVFLIDVSGSMNHPQKLPLVKQSLKMLSKELKTGDRISIVVYAGSNRIVLPPTQGDQKDKIISAIDQLRSGGSTHGSAAILKAYELAHQNYFSGGNNRIILASDGDFNVGVTSSGELTKLVEEERKKGIFLTVLGFGNGNYKDDTMEMLADKGNGNYSYIDSLLEAKKVLVKERLSTLYALAKDVKLQVEFNPALVGAYRLIGYDNRILADEDFTNDTKDAGEIGVGHTVTALYELIPPGSPDLPDVPQLKYKKNISKKNKTEETLTVSLRYKEPSGSKSKLLSKNLINSHHNVQQTSSAFRFSSAVAWFGMHLQQSQYLKKPDFTEVVNIARKSKGNDENGLRAEFIKLVETAELLHNS